jgi:hypothetical protein
MFIPRHGIRILPFGTEKTIDPSIFVPDQPHIINICIRFSCLRQLDRFVPEPELVNTGFTFRYSKKRFPVPSFHPDGQVYLSVQADRSGIEGGIDAHPLHQERIGSRIEIIAPVDRRMPVCHHREFIFIIDPAGIGAFYVFPHDQLFMILEQLF